MAGEMTINLGDFEKAIQDQLKEITSDAIKAVEEGAEVTKKLTLQKLRGRKNKNRSYRSKSYNKDWTFKKTKSNLGTTYEIYNRQGQLTHLLNNGHAITNQYGKWEDEEPIYIQEEKLYLKTYYI